MAIKKVKPPKRKPPRAGKGSKERDERYEKFCQEFVVDSNGARAAREAGYSPDAAKETACRLLTKDNIRKRISDLQAERIARVKLTADEVILDFQRIARFDPRRLFDKKGALLPPSQWPDDVALNYAGLKVKELKRPFTGEVIGHVKELKTKDGLKALEDLAKILGLLRETVDLSGVMAIEQANKKTEEEVRAARAKIQNDC